MKFNKVLSVLLGMLAVVLAIFTAVVSFGAVSKDPVLTVQSEKPPYLAKVLMDSICEGNFENVSLVLQGNPDLGMDREPGDAVGRLFWKAYLDSLTYEIQGDCYPTPEGLALDVQVQFLDFGSVLASLRENAGNMLETRINQAASPYEVYDTDNHYRQEVVDQVLLQAAQDALKEDAEMVTENLTLCMINDGEQWYVVPSPELIHVIAGGSMD